MSKLKQNEPIKNIMTANPQTVNPTTPISKAVTTFLEHRFHHLPVVEGKKLIGMFSYSDFLRIDFTDSFGGDQRQSLQTLDSCKKITDVMAKDLVTLRPTSTVADAAKAFCDGYFHSLPIVNNSGELEGIVTSSDVIRYFSNLY